MHDVLTEHEAAAYLRVTVAEVVALLEAGEIRARQIGTNWRIRRQELDAWLTGAPVPSPVVYSPSTAEYERERVVSQPSSFAPPPPSSYTPPHLAERIRAATITDGERKTITALFADLKGSTALIEGLDPEEARAIKVLHEQTARAIEQIDHDRLEEHYSELAHHYSRSGNAEKAIEYLHKAGQQAMQQSANAEAIRHVTTALELLTTFPETPERMEQELTLRLALGPPLIATQGYAAPEVVQHYSRARVLCEQLADSSRLVTVLWGLSVSHLVRGELRMAQAFAEECVQCAEQTSDVSLLLQASYAAGTALLWGGEYARARTAFEAGITRSQSDQQRHRLTLYGEQDHEVGCVAYLAIVLWFLGYPAQALARTTEALRLARERKHPYSLGLTLDAAIWVHQSRREGHLIQERAEEQSAVAREHGFPDFLAWGTLYRGGALIAQGQVVEGLALLREDLAVTAQGEIGRTYFLVELAEGYARIGQAQEGMAVVAEAFQWVEKNDERIYEAELYRLKGELTLQQENRERGAGSPEQKPKRVSSRPLPSPRSSKRSHLSCEQ